MHPLVRKVVFAGSGIICLFPFMSAPAALLLGLAVAHTTGHPWLHRQYRYSQFLLKASVVGLGFGISAGNAIKAGREGILLTVCSVAGTLLLGLLAGKWLKLDGKTAWLVAAGTAVCGGSAIAAVAPVIQAEEKQVSVSLGVVFLLNTLALFVFPFLGHLFHLSDGQFGAWCAIAIHDTSSVTGAAARFSGQALETATTLKLARALWIMPVALVSGWLFRTPGRVAIPWFIGLFIVAVLLRSYVPVVQQYSGGIVQLAKTGLTLTLFLIGAGLSLPQLKQVGIAPLLLGVLLWLGISVTVFIALTR